MRTAHPLNILIIEDEALIAMDLEQTLLDLGHNVVGVATTYDEAVELARTMKPDLALVDIHLADGPTGVEAASAIALLGHTSNVFTTSNVARIPKGFGDAIGTIGKPYSAVGMRSALEFVSKGLMDPPPEGPTPVSLKLSEAYQQLWG